MDIFRFTNPQAATRMERGIIIEDVKSKMWTESYRGTGEFEIIADIDTGIRQKLPIGSFISHVDTDEVMIVENHEYDKDDNSDTAEVTITGRGFSSFFDQRIVGSDVPLLFTFGALLPYEMPENPTWVQAVHLIRKHIQPSEVDNANMGLPWFETKWSVTGSGTSEAREIKRESLYSAVDELLEIDDLGMRVIRPGRTTMASDNRNCLVLVYRGVDRSSSVLFSHDAGHISSAQYLWSNKKVKNSALVIGRWLYVVVEQTNFAASGINRRTMLVEASDLDQAQETLPVGTARTWIVNAMRIRGRQELAKQKNIALARAEAVEEGLNLRYRQHYRIGDLVTVSGEFGESTKMRVSEHVEIEDDEGFRSYPTFTNPEEET